MRNTRLKEIKEVIEMNGEENKKYYLYQPIWMKDTEEIVNSYCEMNDVDRETLEEEEVENMMALEDQMAFECLVFDISYYFKMNPGVRLFVIGTFGAWNEDQRVGADVDCAKDLIELLFPLRYSCDTTLWEEDGEMYFTQSHHDGHNSFKVVRLTEKGEQFLEDTEDPIKVLDAIENDSTLSEKVRVADCVYGVSEVA